MEAVIAAGLGIIIGLSPIGRLKYVRLIITAITGG